MAQRDYAARGGSRKKKSNGMSKSLLLMVAAIVVAGFAFGLYLLKEKSPEVAEMQGEVQEKAKPKSQLPSRPEETWSYIKELESRTVPTDSTALAKSAQLNEKQKEELRRLEEAEKKAALEKALKAEEAAKAAAESAAAKTESAPKNESNVNDAVPTASEEAALAAKAAEEKKAAEQRKKAELAKQEAAKKAEALKAAESAKVAEATKTTESAKSEVKSSSAGKFGLQCGAFNDRAKAEALQAKLAMTGLNARITESGKWNRVLVGPIGDRPATANIQKQAASIASCVIIGM